MTLSESSGEGRIISFMTPSTTSETDYTGKIVTWTKNTTTYTDSGVQLATTSDPILGVGLGKVRSRETAATGKVAVQVSGLAYVDCEEGAEFDEGDFVTAGTTAGLAAKLDVSATTTALPYVALKKCLGICAVSNKTYTGSGTTSTIATTVVVSLIR